MTGEKVFNTGKVKIGSKYQPPKQMPHMDRDALRLQRALIDKPQIDWDGIAIVLFTLVFCVAIFLMLGE